MAKNKLINFDLPVWPLGAYSISVPKDILEGGATVTLKWLGVKLGPVGLVAIGVIQDSFRGALNNLRHLSIAISANGRVRVSYSLEDEDEGAEKGDVANAECNHGNAIRFMNYCPDCGTEMEWPAGKDPECEECGAPSHELFNCCWSCGLEFDNEDNSPAKNMGTYNLEYDCDSRECDGSVGLYMSYCPWCGSEQDWSVGEDECAVCDSEVSTDWKFCVFCGDELG